MKFSSLAARAIFLVVITLWGCDEGPADDNGKDSPDRGDQSDGNDHDRDGDREETAGSVILCNTGTTGKCGEAVASYLSETSRNIENVSSNIAPKSAGTVDIGVSTPVTPVCLKAGEDPAPKTACESTNEDISTPNYSDSSFLAFFFGARKNLERISR